MHGFRSASLKQPADKRNQPTLPGAVACNRRDGGPLVAAAREALLSREKELAVARHPDVPGLETVRGVGVAGEIARHAHGRLVVGLCLSGGRRIVASGRTWTAFAGQGFVIPPGLPHACQPCLGEAHSYLVLVVDPKRCPVREPEDPALPGEALRIFGQDQAARLLVRLIDAVSQGTSEAIPLFRRLAEALDLRVAKRPAPHPATVRARAVIDAAPDAAASLPDLARLAGISPFHLERLFARDCGVPLGEYVLVQRVRLAASRIAAGLPLAEAALAAGFCDQSHLSRHFRRRMGVPPGCYRREGGGEEKNASGGRGGSSPPDPLGGGGA